MRSIWALVILYDLGGTRFEKRRAAGLTRSCCLLKSGTARLWLFPTRSPLRKSDRIRSRLSWSIWALLVLVWPFSFGRRCLGRCWEVVRESSTSEEEISREISFCWDVMTSVLKQNSSSWSKSGDEVEERNVEEQKLKSPSAHGLRPLNTSQGGWRMV